MLAKLRGQTAIVTLITVVLSVATYLVMPAGPLDAQDSPAQPETSTFHSRTQESEHAHSDTIHNYASETARANDAMLIAAVKTALSDDGVTRGHAVVVDCDHGTVTLAGAVASPADAQHAAQVASSVDGVAGVKNKLTW
jgi:osmotically-inducible protein OsmY